MGILQGKNQNQIGDAASQSEIKQAVSQDNQEPQPSLMTTEQDQDYQYQPQEEPQYSPQQYQPQQYQQPQYQPQSQDYSQQQYSLSSDNVSELSEQVVMEKIRPLKQEIDKSSEFRITAESKLNYLEERLKRIEQIIDRLQLSVLQKVGDYVNNVEDIKKELVETQKSFKSLLPENRKPKTLKE
jgi:predicted transcriptional regulator